MFTERITGKMVEDVTGMFLLGVTKLNEFDILIEFSPSEAIVEVEIAKRFKGSLVGMGLL